jgi:hypothetical protein
MPHFFATPEDLLPVLASVEAKLSVQYTRMGHRLSRDVECWQQGRELPTLSQPFPVESAVAGPAYLVTLGGTVVATRKMSPLNGRDRWSIDQLENPDSTVFWHGGRYGESVLLYGRVATVSRTVVALKLQRAFESALRKQFVRVKAFYVGKCAEELLDRGVRLAGAVQSPPEYDLSRQ